jgi:hypothetical protein
MTLRLHTGEVVPPSTSPQEHHVVVQHRIVHFAAPPTHPVRAFLVFALLFALAVAAAFLPAPLNIIIPAALGAVYIIAKVGGWMVPTFPLATLLLLGAAVFLRLIRVGVIR